MIDEVSKGGSIQVGYQTFDFHTECKKTTEPLEKYVKEILVP